MIMELPKKFKYKDYVRVKGGILYIDYIKRIEDIMYELTYAVRKPVCVYCGRKLKRKECTLDHRFPRSTGGVSIVNNLFITCSLCNRQKDKYLHYDFLKLRKLHKKGQKKLIRNIRKHEIKKFKKTGFILPRKWVKNVDLSEIHCRQTDGNYSRSKRYYRIVKFWETYHKVPRPVILDRNYVLMDGYNIIVFARDFNVETIPAVVLDNVEVRKK